MQGIIEFFLVVLVSVLACFGLYLFYADIGVKYLHLINVPFSVFYFVVVVPCFYFAKVPQKTPEDWEVLTRTIARTILIWVWYGVWIWFAKP